ncbi:MAG: site-specific integrase [Magnetococcales bacterium]|nr:site-specific integrase [Magnetococcales bacterium]
MSQTRQAKTLTPKQQAMVAHHLTTSRYPARDQVIFLMSMKAGMRAKEIANVTWAMVTDSDGQVCDDIALEDRAAKGKRGGRTIPVHPELKKALIVLHEERGDLAHPDWPVIFSERGRGQSPAAITLWFHRLYNRLGLLGCSSHSGRRTFITQAARKIVLAGGSLRDVQQLAGHSALTTTQRYIEGSSDAKRRVVGMI